jgi:hypothetical protein
MYAFDEFLFKIIHETFAILTDESSQRHCEDLIELEELTAFSKQQMLCDAPRKKGLPNCRFQQRGPDSPEGAA